MLLLGGGLVATWGVSGATTIPRAHLASRVLVAPKVLLVGTFHGVRGQYRTIQAAVNAAAPGDWILVAPGDYHEQADHSRSLTAAEANSGNFGSVIIRTPDIHVRGMNRATVILDGTKPGAPKPCDSAAAWQDFGAKNSAGASYGRNGIVVYKANGVTIDNLTACNFLGGAGDSGNAIWWNGGDGTATIGLARFTGTYLTATSTYYAPGKPAAGYGLFASDTRGPGTWFEVYASNFNDSGLYVGACQQVCDMTINHAWSEYSALGYSGTNSGGTFLVENSQFDNNKDGFDTNSQNSADPPTPQNGACLNGGISPITHTHSCWVFMHNYVHDNNNPNVPAAGSAAAGPTGTGMTISGGRNDTVYRNIFKNNGAWGILFVPYPDTGAPAKGQHCQGGQLYLGICTFDPMGNALLSNTFQDNGFFHNPSNSDYGQITVFGHEPTNCFRGNSSHDGTAPHHLEAILPTCGLTSAAANTGGPLFAQVICDTGFGGCPPGAHYPKVTKVVMHPLPSHLRTMPNPCVGVPNNPWCIGGLPI